MTRFGDPLKLLSTNYSRRRRTHGDSTGIVEFSTPLREQKTLCLPTNAPKRNSLKELGELFTVEEVADKLKLNARTVYGWIAEKKLAAVRLGRSVRVSEAALEAFINGS